MPRAECAQRGDPRELLSYLCTSVTQRTLMFLRSRTDKMSGRSATTFEGIFADEVATAVKTLAAWR